MPKWMSVRAGRSRVACSALSMVAAMATGALIASCSGSSSVRESAAIAETTVPSTTTTIPVPSYEEYLPDVVEASGFVRLPAGARLRGAAGDHAVLYDNGCHLYWNRATPLKKCVFGDKTSETVIVLMGDSHAAHWFGGLEEAAITNGWKLVTLTKAGCPAADVTVHSQAPGDKGKKVVYENCDEWRRRAFAMINEIKPDVIVFPTLTRRGVVGAGGKRALSAWRKGFVRSIDATSGTGAQYVIMGDTPRTNGKRIPSCLSAHKADITVCANTRAKAVYKERLAALRRAASDRGALFVDVTNWICGPKICPVVIGDRVVYRDDHHLTDDFARYRAPLIAEVITYALSKKTGS